MIIQCVDCGDDTVQRHPLSTRCRPCHNNKPERRKQKRKRYREKLDVSIKTWQKIRRAIIERDGCCVSCGSTDNLTVDHIIPLHGGGVA